MTVQEIVSDEEVERVHANANFGSISKRDVVNQAVLKCASGYYQGYTSHQIAHEHGLIKSGPDSRSRSEEYRLTSKG